MFNIGSTEVLVVCIVALIVIGPERLPMAVKTAGLWIGRFRRSFYKVKAEIERELNTDEIRRQLHNEAVLAEIEEAKAEIKGVAKDTENSISNIVSSDNFDPGASKSTDAQLQNRKSIQQELEDAGEHIEGITRQPYGTGKNPKLAQASDSEAADSVSQPETKAEPAKETKQAASEESPDNTTSEK